jgi:hypothetical protein
MLTRLALRLKSVLVGEDPETVLSGHASDEPKAAVVELAESMATSTTVSPLDSSKHLQRGLKRRASVDDGADGAPPLKV